MLDVLRAEQGRARLWSWGWAGFYGAVVMGQTVVASTTGNPGSRANARVSIVASGVGAIAMLAFPPPLVFGLEDIDEMPERTELERSLKAEAVRALFLREARWEAFYRSAWNQILGLAVNAGVAAYTYWGLHLGARALLTLGAGSVICEAQVFTSPNGVRRAAAGLPVTSRPARVTVVPISLGEGGSGLALVGHFW